MTTTAPPAVKRPTKWGLLGALISWPSSSSVKELPPVSYEDDALGAHNGTFDAKELKEAVLAGQASGEAKLIGSSPAARKNAFSYSDFAVKMKSPLALDLVRTLRGYVHS